jgi:hypothetical protein
MTYAALLKYIARKISSAFSSKIYRSDVRTCARLR